MQLVVQYLTKTAIKLLSAGQFSSVRPLRTALTEPTNRISAAEQPLVIGNESVPIQLAQYWFPGLAISNAKM